MDRIRSETVDLHHVSEADLRFKISSENSIDDLVESISRIGLITPPVLQETTGRHVIVAGFRRIAACKRLGWSNIDARLLPADTHPLEGLRLAIAENAYHRRLNIVEQARAISRISPFYDNDTALCRDIHGWGLSLNPPFVAKLRQLIRLEEKFQQAAATETVTLDIILKLDRLDRVSADLLVDLLDQLKPTVSQQKELFTLLTETAAVESTTVASLIREAAASRLIAHPEISRRDKINGFRYLLKKRRYPTISLWEQQYQQLVSDLEFPEGLKLVPPENFEGSRFCLILNFENLPQLQQQQKYIASLIHNPKFMRIINKEIADQADLY